MDFRDAVSEDDVKACIASGEDLEAKDSIKSRTALAWAALLEKQLLQNC